MAAGANSNPDASFASLNRARNLIKWLGQSGPAIAPTFRLEIRFDQMISRRSIRWPVALGVVLIVLVVALTVGWVIVSASAALKSEHSAVYWTLLAIGATFLVL